MSIIGAAVSSEDEVLISAQEQSEVSLFVLA